MRGMRLPGGEDTIVALATAPGRGALSVIRLSGPAAYDIAAGLVTPWHPEPRQAHLARLHDKSNALIDRSVVTVYAAPRSYTGENLVELSLHGGQLVAALALAALLDAGAREALPGEFTRRAVANGKMDILQAEGIADLVDAQSRAMHRAALEQLDGNLSRRIGALREMLLQLEALVAYDIDFPEEDDGPVGSTQIIAAGEELLEALESLLITARTGELIRAGALVVIAGAPNAGKSSLFNALVGHARAIVTEIPGTTRDAIEAMVDIGPWPIRLVDTAGLRASVDLVERLGIEASERYIRQADVVLACGENPIALVDIIDRVRELTAAPMVLLRTKADLTSDNSYSAANPSTADSSLQRDYKTAPHAAELAVSAVTGDGVSALAQAITSVLRNTHGGGTGDVPLLTRERHLRAVAQARDEIADFTQEWKNAALPPTVLAVHLRAAAGALESLIGAIDIDDVFDRVFGTFCIGK